jgi:NADPH:quinone reductase-like Zn-dependent oxidoreductase
MQFKPGDKVFGCTGHQIFWSTYGTYAEYVSAHESTLSPMPPGLSFNEAAAVPLAAMTAWQALQPSMPLKGKRVLVHAGAGASAAWGWKRMQAEARRASGLTASAK